MLIQQTAIGQYEGRLAGQKTFVLFPTRMRVVQSLCYLTGILDNYDDGQGRKFDILDSELE